MDIGKLGLDASLIEATRSIVEKNLHPNQEKLDKNKNGKLDKDDFKMLRGEKSVKEEAEDLDETNKFVNVATSKKIVADAEKALSDNPNMFHGAKAGFKRQITIHKKHLENASKSVKEEVEQIDEISKKTLGSYVKKATVDVGTRGLSNSVTLDAKRLNTLSKMSSRVRNINKAVDKLTKEQYDEIEALAAKHGLTGE